MSESSPAACRFAIRDRTAFCFLLSGLLNIDSALTLTSFAGRDDADVFFFAICMLHTIHVDDQQHRPLYGSNDVPPLFAIHDAIAAVSNAMPPCFRWLIRFFSRSHSNRIVIQSV